MTPDSSPHPCPVLDDQTRVASLTTDLSRVLRKLERDLRNCPACSSYEECPLLADLNATIDAAIQHVTDEWNSAPPNLMSDAMPTLSQLDNILAAAQRHSNDAYGRYLLEIAATYSLALIAHSLIEIKSALSSLETLDALRELLTEINPPKE